MDVIALLDQFAKDMNPPRGDEQLLHVTDLPGCDRQTWARMHGLLRDFDADTYRKFTMGKDVENSIVTALGRVRSDLVIGARIVMSLGFDGIEGREVPEDYVPRADEIVGHPDALLDGVVIEAKSTEFMVDRNAGFSRIVPVKPSELQYYYKLQVEAYALALDKMRALVIIQCRASGLISAVSFDPRSYRDNGRLLADEVADRMRDLLALRHLDDMPEPTLHPSTLNKSGQSWLCKHCRFMQCKLNRYKPVEIVGRESIEIVS